MKPIDHAKLDHLEAEYLAAEQAGDPAAMHRIAAEYDAELPPLDDEGRRLLRDCIAAYYGFTAGAIDRLQAMRAIPVPGSLMVH